MLLACSLGLDSICDMCAVWCGVKRCLLLFLSFVAWFVCVDAAYLWGCIACVLLLCGVYACGLAYGMCVCFGGCSGSARPGSEAAAPASSGGGVMRVGVATVGSMEAGKHAHPYLACPPTSRAANPARLGWVSKPEGRIFRLRSVRSAIKQERDNNTMCEDCNDTG